MKSETRTQMSESKIAPPLLKVLITEFLDFIVNLAKANRPFLPLVKQAVESGAETIYLDAPEAGGSGLLLANDLRKEFPGVKIVLIDDELTSDRRDHFERIGVENISRLESVSLAAIGSAQNSPSQRAVLSINHAHKMNETKFQERLSLLADRFNFIIIGEGNNKSLWQVVGMTVFVPLIAFLLSWKVKPFRISRFALTYFVPVLIPVLVWDGLIALVRIRSPKKLLESAQAVGKGDWRWSSGKLKNGRGGYIIHLFGEKK